jgi:hypothetical protein
MRQDGSSLLSNGELEESLLSVCSYSRGSVVAKESKWEDKLSSHLLSFAGNDSSHDKVESSLKTHVSCHASNSPQHHEYPVQCYPSNCKQQLHTYNQE